METPDGSKIPIEQRDAKEVTHIAGKQMVPEGVSVENPAFDVTPAKYVTAIVTERGIARAPYGETLARLAGQAAVSALAASALSSQHSVRPGQQILSGLNAECRMLSACI